MKSRFSFTRAILVGLLLCVTLLAVGCGKGNASQESKATPYPTQALDMRGTGGQGTALAVTALGTVRPAQTLQLGFRASGLVHAVSVYLGMEVKAGDLLATLDTSALELELQSAQEEVAIRQAVLDGLINGPGATLVARAEAEHAQQVAQAEVALQIKQLQLEKARLEDPSASVGTLRASVEQLKLQLAQLRMGPSEADVVMAQSAVDSAQAQLDGLLAGPEEQAIEIARLNWELAKNRLWQAQLERDAVAGLAGVPGYQKDLAEAAVGAAELSALIAQLEWELTAKGATKEAIRIARAAMRQAEAQRNRVLEGQETQAIGLDILQVQIDAAEEQLAQAVAAQEAYTITLDMLAAEVETARLALQALQAWENPYLDEASGEEVAQARARLRQAELAAEQLEWQLRGTELRAPFDGVVSAVYLSPGEWGAPGVPAVEVIDTGAWYVETRNVGELVIGQVKMGQEAVVRVIAFRDQELRGRITAISPVAVVQQGDTTYTAMVELEPTELNLRPGMNAQVEVVTN
ncbi:MAG: efflux RND transporter periplasmic adaptor subunit [Anaerolineae bacterium]|nr:MAG: efflux RND transporter periplasmic adaptor subunit [Anaerolineae bacterium]